MLLGDLMRRPVTSGDDLVGFVVDCRFVVDGPPDGLLASARIAGLIVGDRHREAFLGYERTGVRKPLPLAWFFRRRERLAFLVAWDDVERIDAHGVHLRDGWTRWSAAITRGD